MGYWNPEGKLGRGGGGVGTGHFYGQLISSNYSIKQY